MNQKQIDAMCLEVCAMVHNAPDPDAVAGAVIPVLAAMLVDRNGAATVIDNLRDLIEQIQQAESN